MTNLSEPAPVATPVARVKTALHARNEAIFVKMKVDVKTPGAKLGFLARRLEAAARDLQDALDTYGTAAIVGSIAGKPVKIPLQTGVKLLFWLQAGDGETNEWEMVLRPGHGVPEAPVAGDGEVLVVPTLSKDIGG